MKKGLTISLLIIGLLTSCSYFKRSTPDGAPSTEVDMTHAPDPTPKAEPLSAFGNAPNYKIKGKTYHVLRTSQGYHKRGMASWYGTKFHGRLTSSREPYNMFAMTAASPELPIPCYVKVTNLGNGRSAVVRVNDRGPFHGNRLMDLSYAAAQKLGIVKNGTAYVDIKSISTNNYNRNTSGQETAQNSIQIGAFKLMTNAQHLVTALRQYPVLKRPHIINQNGLHKVQLGPLTRAEQLKALTLLDTLNLNTLSTH